MPPIRLLEVAVLAFQLPELYIKFLRYLQIVKLTLTVRKTDKVRNFAVTAYLRPKCIPPCPYKWATLIHPPYSIFSKENGGLKFVIPKPPLGYCILFGRTDYQPPQQRFFYYPVEGET